MILFDAKSVDIVCCIRRGLRGELLSFSWEFGGRAGKAWGAKAKDWWILSFANWVLVEWCSSRLDDYGLRGEEIRDNMMESYGLAFGSQ